MWRILFSLLLGPVGLLLCCSPVESTAQAEADGSEAPVTPQVHLWDTLPYIHTDTFDLDYLRGRFEPSAHPDFTDVEPALTDRDGTYFLRKDAAEAFARMAAAAAQDSIELRIISATRNFARQKMIWEAKWKGQRLLEGRENAPEVYPDPAQRALAILRWSSMPGTSRHHWGTDLDINRLTNDYFEQGRGLREYQWLQAHAADYGFCQPYSPKGDKRPYGYHEEKWHWSYLPVATRLTELARRELNDAQIDGFAGAQVATELRVVERYVLGINPDCQPTF
jgi:D-alanyl-D-alanine carboxypeptidase